MTQTLNESHPELMKEWDYEKNNEVGVYPEELTYGTSVEVFWKCAKRGHSWQRPVSGRTINGYNCPECKNLRNGSLADNSPDALKAWDYEKNKTVDPNSIPSSHRVPVWWKCKYGHEWEQAPILVTKKDEPCKICRKVRNGSLASLRPEIASMLHPDKNNDIDPRFLPLSTNFRYVWLCKNGHEFENSVNKVVRANGSCPKCKKHVEYKARPKVLESPFAKYWDTEKNNAITLNGSKLRLGSKFEAHWKCNKGHEWFMRIGLFATKDGCPECLQGTKSARGYTRHPKLSIGNPEVAAEWQLGSHS